MIIPAAVPNADRNNLMKTRQVREHSGGACSCVQLLALSLVPPSDCLAQTLIPSMLCKSSCCSGSWQTPGAQALAETPPAPQDGTRHPRSQAAQTANTFVLKLKALRAKHSLSRDQPCHSAQPKVGLLAKAELSRLLRSPSRSSRMKDAPCDLLPLGNPTRLPGKPGTGGAGTVISVSTTLAPHAETYRNKAGSETGTAGGEKCPWWTGVETLSKRGEPSMKISGAGRGLYYLLRHWLSQYPTHTSPGTT